MRRTALFTVLLPALLLPMLVRLPLPNHQLPPSPNWEPVSLPDGWRLDAPHGFVSHRERGIDSQPGTLVCVQDSIHLAYDIGREMSEAPECSFSWSVAVAQQQIQSGYYTYYDQPSIVHAATIDTIDSKAAVLIRPVVSGKGTVAISIIDCQTGKWISISGNSLSARHERLVLAMFKTLKATQACD